MALQNSSFTGWKAVLNHMIKASTLAGQEEVQFFPASSVSNALMFRWEKLETD